MLELERLLFYRYRHWHCNYISASIASISLLGKITVNLVHVLFVIFTIWIYCSVRMILQRWMKLRFWNDITTFLIKSVENNNRDLPFARSFFYRSQTVIETIILARESHHWLQLVCVLLHEIENSQIECHFSLRLLFSPPFGRSMWMRAYRAWQNKYHFIFVIFLIVVNNWI